MDSDSCSEMLDTIGLEPGWLMLRWCRRKCRLQGVPGGSASCHRPTQHRTGFGESHLHLNLKGLGEAIPFFFALCYLFYVVPGVSIATKQHMKGGCAAKQKTEQRAASIKVSDKAAATKPLGNYPQELLCQKSTCPCVAHLMCF